MSADMRRMAEAFNTSVSALEDELMQLILDGQIQARIDSHNKVLDWQHHFSSSRNCFWKRNLFQCIEQILFAKDADQRSCTFEKSLNLGEEFKRRTRLLVLRAAVLRNQIHVKVIWLKCFTMAWIAESLNLIIAWLQSSPRDSGGQTTEVAIPSSSGSSPRNWRILATGLLKTFILVNLVC